MKTKLDKQLKQKLTVRHLTDYENGSWGAATSTPYRVKKWLSKSLSDRLLADAYTEYDRAKAVFDAIPASKRVVYGATMLCPELRRWYDIGCQAALPTKVEGHAVYLACVDQACYKNSYRRYKAELRARDAAALCFVVNGNDTGCPRYDRLMKWMIYWDADMQRFYRLEWNRASTAPVEDRHRRNWGRKGKQKEFLKECEKLQAKLLEEGIEIASLVEDGGRWHDTVYVDCYDPVEIQDPAGEFAAAEGGLAVLQEAVREEAAAPDAGMTVCFTGALSVTRLEASNAAKAAGFGVKSSVTKGLTYLVTNTPFSGSSKNRAAQALGVKVIDEKEFARLCKELKGPREKAPEAPKQEPKPEPVHALPPLPELPKPPPAWFMSE